MVEAVVEKDEVTHMYSLVSLKAQYDEIRAKYALEDINQGQLELLFTRFQLDSLELTILFSFPVTSIQ
jgi:hypothetical protein